jgi:DNA-binding transcriptional MerR regulator
MFRISRLTLRYYEFRGMIKRRRNIGDVRVYGWADCDRIAFIIKCRRAGVARSEILTLIETVDELADGPQEGRAEDCLALIERLERRRRSLDDGLAELRHLYALLGTKSGGPHGGADRG